MKTRIELIQERLQTALQPTHLNIIDDSHKHIGHAGAQGGAGHYTVEIASERFTDLSRLEIHRLVYAAVDDLIPHEIHALKIKVKR